MEEKESIEKKLQEFSITISDLDPRIDRCKIHPVESIVFISLSAVLCGCNTWNDIEDFGRSKEVFFRERIPNFHGVPSHDTFSRFFASLDTEKFEHYFRKWAKGIVGEYKGVIAVDGKTICGAYKSEKDKKTKSASSDDAFKKLHMVSAYATSAGISLGQVRVDEKSNEITAVPELLDALDIKGCVITADALNCQKKIASKVIENGGDYLLVVKDNHKNLKTRIISLVEEAKIKSRLRRNDSFTQTSKGHGRKEIRTCITCGDVSCLGEVKKEWAGLKTIGCIESKRTILATNEVSVERRYFITSVENDAEKILNYSRQHWMIENGLHWQLDVNFKEDDDGRKKNNAAQNFSLLRKMALAMLKRDTTDKRPINRKRNVAGWDNLFLWKIIEDNL